MGDFYLHVAFNLIRNNRIIIIKETIFNFTFFIRSRGTKN